MSDEVIGCWKGICGSLEKRLRKLGKSFTMTLYEAKLSNSSRILTPGVLTHNYLVHDAHETHEYALIQGDVILVKDRDITFENTSTVSDRECCYYTPFNDKRYNVEMIGVPMKILNEEKP